MITRKQKAHWRTLLCSCFAREYQQVIVCASPIVQQMIVHPSKGQKWSNLDLVMGTIWKKSTPWNKHSQAVPTKRGNEPSSIYFSCGKKNTDHGPFPTLKNQSLFFGLPTSYFAQTSFHQHIDLFYVSGVVWAPPSASNRFPETEVFTHQLIHPFL